MSQCVILLKTAGWVLPHGAKLQTRCKELGMYKLLGAASPQCQNGEWSSKLPSCVPTTLITNFTGKKQKISARLNNALFKHVPIDYFGCIIVWVCVV